MGHAFPPPGNGRVYDGSLPALLQSTGPDFLTRSEPLLTWRDARLRAGAWGWARALDAPFGPRVTARDEAGIAVHGLNFVTQDPLSLAAHPALLAAAREAVHHGLHAPGSPCFVGSSGPSVQLEAMLAELLVLEHVLLFPSGWAAAFGALTALLQPTDHVVIDSCAHAALVAGAFAATPHVHRYAHNDHDALDRSLAALRDADAHVGILVVTEALFPFESDSPDLRGLHERCRSRNAALLVATGHDLGVSGQNGMGVLAAQQMLGHVEFVVGSFAKTLAVNGGFFATRSASAKQLVRFRASPYAASNGISPIQAAIARESLRIVTSPEGERLRANLASAVGALREACAARGLPCLGTNAALVPIAIGSEHDARLTAAFATERGVVCAVLEEPFVPPNTARLALHVMAAHRTEHAIEAAQKIAAALAEARASPR